MTEVRGVPDQSSLPSLCMNYQSTFTLSPEADAVGTWSFDASLIPHPLCFMAYSRQTSVGLVRGTLLNSQIDGATHDLKYQSWRNLAQRWRLAYMSVTVYQDGPDLANQGTIVVAQPPVAARVRHFSWCRGAYQGPLESVPPVCEWTEEDRPDFTRSQAMPNAYFNRSREGAYVPLKLTETCQDWVSERDEIAIGMFLPGLTEGATYSGVYHLVNAAEQVYPFYDLVNTRLDGAGHLVSQATSPPLSGNWAHISARNLATTTSYSFFVRCGIEMQVSPSSTLSPQLKLSPPYDPVALTTYFSVVRELKDAYPADYNTTGKLWGVLKQALNSLDPVISVMPGNKVIKPLVTAGVQAGDVLVARRKKRKQKKKAKKAAARQQGPAPVNRTPAQAGQPKVYSAR